MGKKKPKILANHNPKDALEWSYNVGEGFTHLIYLLQVAIYLTTPEAQN